MDETEELQKGQADPQSLSPGTRVLLRTVYIMGVILVLLMIALVAGIVWKATNRKPSALAEAARIDLGLAPGVEILGTELEGDRLAVTTRDQIIVIDLRKRRIEARIGLRP